jgi:hypothetical protein
MSQKIIGMIVKILRFWNESMIRVFVTWIVVALSLINAGCNRNISDDSSEGALMADQAVLVYLKLSDDRFGTSEERDQIRELSDQLEKAIQDHGVGEFDGDEFGEGQCTLFMYGPDADALFETIEPMLRDSSLTANGHAVRRYGDANDHNSKETRIDF